MSEELKPVLYEWLKKAYELGVKRDSFSAQISESDLPSLELYYAPKMLDDLLAAWGTKRFTRPSPWIPVTPETLPEEKKNHKSGWVIVLRDMPDVSIDERADFSRYDFEKKEWPYDNDIITHYMPIPELPSQ